MRSHVVAPHGGAWIEIDLQLCDNIPADVAPHGGAWIEIYPIVPQSGAVVVAPHGGAWIEIAKTTLGIMHWPSSPLTEGRGLK